MNESSCSSKFQTDLRKALPGCEVIKHADKSLIGMVDASVTFNKKTVWIEYKYIKPATKGVQWRPFLKEGIWSPLEVASASPTQFDMAKRLARAGHCCYLFWVLDHEALRMKIKHVIMWHPITQMQYAFANTYGAVEFFAKSLTGENPPFLCW